MGRCTSFSAFRLREETFLEGVPVNVHSVHKPSSRPLRFGESRACVAAILDLADFRCVDLGGIDVAKRGVVWMDGEPLSFAVAVAGRGELRGEGVRGKRPPAVLVEKTRPFVGVQTSTVAISVVPISVLLRRRCGDCD